MRILALIIFSLFNLTSCLDPASTARRGVVDNEVNGGKDFCVGISCNDFTGGGGGIGTDENPIVKVEIRHLIEPQLDGDSDAGEHKRKLTIPKNYSGKLYVAGINISTLNSESVKVRFRFGVDKSPIEIPATVSTAPGLTPQTNTQVLVLNLRNKPFNDTELPYDLFDYNNYDFAGTGSDPGALTEPVHLNRDDNLFCRGLSLEDDSTFNGNVSSGCVGGNDTCKYAYARVIDKGLVERSGSLDIPINPSERTIESGNDGYHNDDDETKLARCLPDNPDFSGGSYVYDLTNTFGGLESFVFIDSTMYIYRGPYRPINENRWQIRSDAIIGQFGLFKKIPDFNNNGQLDDSEIQYGQQSLLFPLYTQFDLPKDTQYLGNATADAVKSLITMTNNGDSAFMDGCNARAASLNEITGEHIGSCNVTATIEIVTTDDDKKETVIDVTDEVKLQLVPAAVVNSNGEDVLRESFEQCSSSNQCGSDSCCINKRCWSKSLVSQCVEDLPSFGNLVTGDSCNSDYECASLCCNTIDGRCAPHNTVSENQSFCSKTTGQSCISKEFCQKHPVTLCKIVDTGNDSIGNPTCALRCVTAEVFGDCVSNNGEAGTCKPPCQPEHDVFVPGDPNSCENAISFNDLVELANDPDRVCGASSGGGS